MTDTEISTDTPNDKLVCEWLEEEEVVGDPLGVLIESLNSHVLFSSHYDMDSALEYDMFIRRSPVL